MTKAPVILSLFVWLAGCGESTTEEAAPAPPSTAPESEEVPPGPRLAGPIDDAWVAERVAAAEERLSSSEAGQLVLDAVRAHGGLTSWLGAGTVRFTFDYHPVDETKARRHTVNHVDLWRSRARQEVVGSDVAIGWDGETAWSFPDDDAFPGSARFWATTPYYFVGVPFVFADPGTQLEQLADATLAEEDGSEQSYHLVKVTYESGTGDSPDDYYILYIHPESKRVRALRYVVAYPGFFPEGGHTPEKLMRYEGLHEVQGLVFAGTLPTYAFDGETGVPGELVTNITVTDISLGDPIEAARFAAPEGASESTEIAPPPG